MMDIDAIPDHEDKNMKTLRNWIRICFVKMVVLILLLKLWVDWFTLQCINLKDLTDDKSI